MGENGTPHYQGFVRFKWQTSFSRVKQLLPRAHLEKQRGTNEQAALYCKKDGDFQEYGEYRSQTSKENKAYWAQIVEYAEQGELSKIKEEYPHAYFMYMPKIFSLRKRNIVPLDGELEHEWWVGPSGSGKSKLLWELYPNHYAKDLNKWWDGYMDEEVVAIEEFDPHTATYLSPHMKKWCDRYPFPAQIKGGTSYGIRPRKVIVLSNYTIDECFKEANDRNPILRRFKVKKFYDFFNEVTLQLP